MQSNDKVIELSRLKITLLMIGSAIFVAIGLWIATLDGAGLQRLVANPPFGYRYFPFNNPTAAHYFGVVTVVFFGACSLFGIYKFFDKTPGLILSSAGFVDNASAAAVGFVPWSDVTDLQSWQLNVTRRLSDLPDLQSRQQELSEAPTPRATGRRTRPILIVMVRDPQRYMRKGNPLKRILNRANLSMCGSPIAIPTAALKIDFDELSSLFQSYWSRYRSA